MIKITFPDGSVREYNEGVTGLQIAESISSRLAQDVLACGVNGETIDLMRPINEDADFVLYKWDDEQGKHAFWHTSAHLLAEALQELYPGIQFGIGPAIENGFYYDVDPGDDVVIKESDLPAIEQKMIELAARKEPLVRKSIAKDDALKMFGERGETYKCELISELEDGHITTYTQGAFTDLCRGPHLPSTAPIKAIKLLSVAGAYWRGQEDRKPGRPQADDPYLRHYLPEEEDVGRISGDAGRSQETRPPQDWQGNGLVHVLGHGRQGIADVVAEGYGIAHPPAGFPAPHSGTLRLSGSDVSAYRKQAVVCHFGTLCEIR